MKSVKKKRVITRKPKPYGSPLDGVSLARVQKLRDDEGPVEAARIIGVSRTTLDSALAGHRISYGTMLAIRAGLGDLTVERAS